jgi:Domain of unknown function (DUF5979)
MDRLVFGRRRGVVLVALTLVGLWAGLVGVAWGQQAGQGQQGGQAQGVAAVSVSHVVRGVERTPGFAYRFELSCVRPNGTLVGSVSFVLAGGGLRTFTAADVVGLSVADVCSVRTVDNNGAESVYSSSVPMRADGSQPDPVPGVVGSGGFVSAPTLADGRTISVVSTFGGDVAVVKRVEGAPAGSVAVYELRVACDGGFSRSLLLGDGQQQILTGIPAGVQCRVSESRGGGASPRFVDNSGVAGDGVVTVVATSSACWDLRNTSSECRAVVTVVNQFDASADVVGVSSVPPTTQETTTTVPADQQAPATVAPVAAAPVAEPEVVGADEAVTG